MKEKKTRNHKKKINMYPIFIFIMFVGKVLLVKCDYENFSRFKVTIVPGKYFQNNY